MTTDRLPDQIQVNYERLQMHAASYPWVGDDGQVYRAVVTVELVKDADNDGRSIRMEATADQIAREL